MAARKSSPPKTVDEYLATVPPKFRPLLKRLRRTIRAAAPDAQEVISYRMPAYKQDGILVYFSAFTDHCSLFMGRPLVRMKFAGELEPFESGKGTLRFTPEHPLPDGLVTRLVRACVAENAARRSTRGRPSRGKGLPPMG